MLNDGATDFLYGFCRLSLLDHLPEELLWTICGFLDVRTLCTARLVCTTLHQGATAHICKLHLDGRSLEQDLVPDFRQFSGLTDLAITLTRKTPLFHVAHPGFAPFVTHVELDAGYDLGDAKVLAPLRDLPKLASLTLNPLEDDRCNLALLPSGLETLTVRGPEGLSWAEMEDVRPLNRFPNLKSLTMDMVEGAGACLGVLTTLHNLVSLDMSTCPSALGLVRVLTGLTSLSWLVYGVANQSEPMFQEVSHLTGLSELHVSCWWDNITHDSLACIAHLTRLTHLDLGDRSLASCVAGSTAIVPLTRLVCLEIECGTVGRSQLSCLNLKALKSLTMHNLQGPIHVLFRATRLTRLEMHCVSRGSVQQLSASLVQMIQLQALTLLNTCEEFQLNCILCALTNLTKLDYDGPFVPSRDLKACAALPGLRSLRLLGQLEVTRACLPALQEMTGLTHLHLQYTGIAARHLTREVLSGFNVERRRRGWPDLKIECE